MHPVLGNARSVQYVSHVAILWRCPDAAAQALEERCQNI